MFLGNNILLTFQKLHNDKLIKYNQKNYNQ